MAVVKADGYGHGLLPSARAALAGGATWLGVAQLDEALALRAGGVDAPVLGWLWAPDEAELVARALAADVDVSVSALWALEIVVAGARAVGRPASVHLKIDTGLARNGSHPRDWPALVEAAAAYEAAGQLTVTGIWSHLVYADEPTHPTNEAQRLAFLDAVGVAAQAGVRPRYRHLANSAATLALPETHFDLVRPGVAVYGLNPVPDRPAPGLVPAMTLRSHVTLAKSVDAGQGVSYGHAYTTAAAGTLALIPLGYADGIPRQATNVGPLRISASSGPFRAVISGRVCMDQFVVDVGRHAVAAGDAVELFGTGADGAPTAQDWADAIDSIHYEIVTRIGSRVPRRHIGTAGVPASASESAAADARPARW